MFLANRKLLIGSLLGAGLFFQLSLLPFPALAQVDLDALNATGEQETTTPPPEPVTAPEPEAATIPAPVADKVAEQPSDDPLTPMVDDIAAETDLPATQAASVPHSGMYFDADSIVPDSDLQGAVGPREVDPKYEPGSRFVTVRKGALPNSVPAMLVSAQRALQLERYTSALEMYEQLYKRDPKNKRVLMGLAVAQQYSGFKESAIATYEELLKIDPDNTDATVNMLGLLQNEYPSVAYRKLKDLWESNSQNPGLAAQLGLMSASIGNAQDAIRYLGIAASLEPNNPSHYYNMAVISDQSGASKDAVELYQKALEIDVAYGARSSIPREQIYDRLARLRRL